jgi:hypothetical protein
MEIDMLSIASEFLRICFLKDLGREALNKKEYL